MRVSNDVLQVLSAARTEAGHLYLTGQIDRNLYQSTNKVLEAAGGKWNRKAGAHVFDGDASDRIEQIILTGSVDVPKGDKEEFEFFPTPPAVVARVHEIAEVEIGMCVLEPSAGRGNMIAGFNGVEVVDCIEKMPANAEYLRSVDWINSVVEADFLEVEPNPIYDRVLMNPPFSKQADIKHVLHALKFLKPGGLLVAVMAASVLFRENKLTTDFRSIIAATGGNIEELPEGSFKQSGTMVNTVIVTIPN